MALNDITHTIPPQHRDKLLDGEMVYHFSFISFQAGGCSGAPVQNQSQWILVSNKRVLYEGRVREAKQANNQTVNTYQHASGSIPIKKISFVGRVTETSTEGCGCSTTAVYILKINSGGGVIEIAIPHADESARLQNIIEEIISSDVA